MVGMRLRRFFGSTWRVCGVRHKVGCVHHRQAESAESNGFPDSVTRAAVLWFAPAKHALPLRNPPAAKEEQPQ